ncbi:glycosyltransferase [Armatimonas rosea]|uniref:GT2 family glycosyltransferase n=1 Tax=Armatimonas rosea TaxID=685828 RepID=A0A7W9SNY9_ARMRO|nr:GT2 family glycosyltransferase [Armatimonas rosea]
MLAVIVLNWNGGDDTKRCLESLAASTLPHRVYLVDNGSTDGSLETLTADVVIRNGRNLGFAGGCNVGAKQALADGATHLFFLNNDATLAADTLEKLHAALTDDVVAVSPRIGSLPASLPRLTSLPPAPSLPLKPDFVGGKGGGVRGGGTPPPRSSAPPLLPRNAEPEGEGVGQSEERAEAGGSAQESALPLWFERGQLTLHEFVIARHVTGPGPTDFCSGCALLVRATDFERVGGFDEALFAYYEDIDLCLKLNGKCLVVPDAPAWHKGSASTGGSESPRSLFYTFRNSRTVALRHGSAEQKQQYTRTWLRQGLWLASFVGGRSRDAGAAALLGMLCARLKPSGELPPFPLWLLWPLAILNQKLPRRDRMAI